MDEGGLLRHEETLRLIARVHAGDEYALEELIINNAALVKSIVRKYMNRGAEYEDLYQIGCMGLVKAVRNFDASYNVRFSTYAVPMIAGEIKRFLRDDGIIKVSRSLKELAARALSSRERLSAQLGREPTLTELAECIEADPEDVMMALEAARPHMSIYEPVYGEESDALLIDHVSGNESETNDTLNRVMLKEMLGSLPPRERQIIMLRYFSDKTQSEIAKVMGVSQVQISRLESKILAKLRDQAQ